MKDIIIFKIILLSFFNLNLYSNIEYSDKKIALEQVNNNVKNVLKNSSEELKKDKELIFRSIKKDKTSLKFADKSLLKDRDFMLKAIDMTSSFVLKYADKSLLKNKYFAMESVKIDGDSLFYLDKSFKKNKTIVRTAIDTKGVSLYYASDKLKKDKELVLLATKKSFNALKFAHNSLKKDKVFMLKVLKTIKKSLYISSSSLEFMDESLKKDKDIIFAALKKESATLRFIDEDLKKDKKFIYKALKININSLYYLNNDLKKDKKFILKIIKEISPYALYFLDKKFKKDEEIIFPAIYLDYRTINYIDESLFKDKKFMLKIISINPKAIKYVHENLKKDKNFMNEILKVNPNILNYDKKYELIDLIKFILTPVVVSIKNVLIEIKIWYLNLIKENQAMPKTKSSDLIIINKNRSITFNEKTVKFGSHIDKWIKVLGSNYREIGYGSAYIWDDLGISITVKIDDVKSKVTDSFNIQLITFLEFFPIYKNNNIKRKNMGGVSQFYFKGLVKIEDGYLSRETSYDEFRKSDVGRRYENTFSRPNKYHMSYNKEGTPIIRYKDEYAVQFNDIDLTHKRFIKRISIY